MGAYIDQDGLEKRIGVTRLVQLTNDSGGATVDTDVLAEVITDAEGEVNGYLGVAYDLPLASVPPLVSRLAYTVAEYLLYQRTPRPKFPEQVQANYDRATKLLEKIAAGGVTLGVVPEPTQNPGRAAVLDGQDRVFTRSGMGRF